MMHCINFLYYIFQFKNFYTNICTYMCRYMCMYIYVCVLTHLIYIHLHILP